MIKINNSDGGPYDHYFDLEERAAEVREGGKAAQKVYIFKELVEGNGVGPADEGYLKFGFVRHDESGSFVQDIYCAGKNIVTACLVSSVDAEDSESRSEIGRRIKSVVETEPEIRIVIFKTGSAGRYRSFVVERPEGGGDGFVAAEAETEVISLKEDIFSRNKAIIETGELKDKKVVLVGLGSIGSHVAIELAKAGVGNFVLIDMDRLSAANICRHSCGLDDIGRLKVLAVKDRLKRVNPFIDVAVSAENVNADLEKTRALCAGADLIVTSTDTTASRRMMNYIALSLKVIAIFSGVFERAKGGRVFKVDPVNGGACLECHQIETFEEKPGFVAYSAAEDPRDLTIQPGLSADIGLTSTLSAKMAIEALRVDKSEVMPYELIIMKHYSAAGGVKEPVRFMCARGADISRNPECPVCGKNSMVSAFDMEKAGEEDEI